MGGFDTPPIHPETLFPLYPSGSKAENKNLFSIFDPLGGDIKKVSGSLKEPETTILLLSHTCLLLHLYCVHSIPFSKC